MYYCTSNLWQAFCVVFQKAIEKAEAATDVETRVLNLIDCITYFVFVYTTRGLFECDKLIFSAQMAFQVQHSLQKESKSADSNIISSTNVILEHSDNCIDQFFVQ